MARKLAVEIVGSAASLKAALGSATAATTKFAGDYKAAFAGMTTSTLTLAVAEDRLAMSTAKFGVGTQGAARATVAYRKEMDALSRSATTSMQNIGRSLTTYVTLPVAIIGYASTKMAVEFNRNMVMIQTQAGASTQEVQNLSKEVLELAKTSPQGPVKLAQGLYHLESLGLRGAKAMEALKLSSMAAGMGIADIESVTTALGGAVVTEIRGTKDYAEAMGTLNAAVGVGNMRMEDMAAALGTGLLPAAKNAGLSLDQVGAALAVLTDRGLSAENAGTRLRMTFAFMQAPSRKAQQALSRMGIDAEYMSKKLRSPTGLLDVLTMLHEGMKRVGAAQGSADILKAFGGGRSGAGILTLVQSLDSSVSSYQGKLEQIQKNQGDFGRNMKAYMETPSYKLATALNTLQANMTKLGQAMTPVIVGIAKTIAVIADAFSALPRSVKQSIGIVIGVLAVGGPLFLAIAGTRRMITAIGTAFKILPVTSGAAITTTEVQLVGLQATAGRTAVAVAGIRTAFMALGKMAAILIPIQILINVTGDWDKFKTLVATGKLGSAAMFALFGTTFGSENWGQGKTPARDTSKEAKQWDATFGYDAMFPAGGNRPDEGTRGPNAPKPTKPGSDAVPRTVLPRRFVDSINQARLKAGLKDDIQVAKSIESWWAAQLKLAERVYGKGSEAYSTILGELANAHDTVASLESQYASSAKKSTAAVDKAAKARAKIPVALQNELYAAQSAKNHAKELATLLKIKKYFEAEIKAEKSIVAKNLERKSLASVVSKISAVRKEMGDSILAKDEARVKAAQNVGTSAYVSALLKLKSDILAQIKIQKINVDLTNKLSSVNDDLASARQSVVDQLKTTMGDLGGGPIFGGGDQSLRLFALGIRHTTEQYTKDITAQINAFKLLQKNLAKLKARGAPAAMLDELRGQGMAAFPEVFALANEPDKSKLGKFFKAFSARQNLIQRTATAEIKANVVNLKTSKLVYIGGGRPTAVGKAAGGPVHGSGTGDSVPALLTPGEWVLNKRQQQTLGKMVGAHPSEIAPKLFGLGGVVGGIKGAVKGAGDALGVGILEGLLPGGKIQSFISLLQKNPKAAAEAYAKWRGPLMEGGQMVVPWMPGLMGAKAGENQIAFSLYHPGTGKRKPIGALNKSLMKGYAKPDPHVTKLMVGGNKALKRLAKEERGSITLPRPFGKMTKKELVAEYQNESAQEVNAPMRRGTFDRSGAISSRISKAMYGALMTEMRRSKGDLTLYRGSSWTPFGKFMTPEKMQNMVGKTISDKGFSSTSTDLSTANSFATTNHLFGKGNAALTSIKVPKGTKMLKVGNKYGGFEMSEVILPPGLKLRIDDVKLFDHKGGGQYARVHATAVPKLGAGGVVTRPTLAMIGERGPEAVVPLSRGGYGGDSFKIGTVHVHGVENVDDLMEELRKKGRSGTGQSRGRMKANVPLR